MASYRTLKGAGEAVTEVKGSKFIAYSKNVDSEEEAKQFIAKIRKLHPDATHNVPAYRFTSGGKLALYFNDDGEPSGSSGKPVFKVLEMKDLTDVVVVVTRYFGGTKLGFGGLARAYRQAAIEAIENAGIMEKCETIDLKIVTTYSESQKIRMLVIEFGRIKSEDFSDTVTINASIPEEENEKIREKLLAAGCTFQIE
ncbi:putative YigZ family protein [Methanohalophilus levihalophilus]|uniref:YigZ family protein n=1 Tax=Methanohalophilus levihalophilus TaxID=1431282 RepID=UPI001AEB85E3|nr:YigZ family protein [Methanohalophilus levihalophilus]MBP2029481.1 putative YigZ family protein [Methanohalophilus levihalophilus]